MYVKSGAAQNDSGAAAPANFRNNVQMTGEEKDRVSHILVIDVADGQPNGVGVKVTEDGLQPFFPVFEKHKIEYCHLMAAALKSSRDKGESEGKRRNKARISVFGYQKDFHSFYSIIKKWRQYSFILRSQLTNSTSKCPRKRRAIF